MADKRKVEIVWGIKLGGRLLKHLMGGTRSSAIYQLQHVEHGPFSTDPLPTWAALRKQGYTVHKLEVRDAR